MEQAFIRPRVTPNISRSVKSRQGSNTKQSSKNKKIAPEPQGVLVVLRPSRMTQTVIRKFAIATTANSDASGILLLNTQSVSANITSLGAEFTNFSQEFQQYRVLRFGIHFFPSTTNATSTTGPYQGGVISAGWQQKAPTTVSSIEQAMELIKFSTMEEKEIYLIPGFQNCKLWNDTTVAYPVDRDFGLVFQGVSTLAVSSSIFTLLKELTVEFQMPL
jgi:hypothetical protein